MNSKLGESLKDKKTLWVQWNGRIYEIKPPKLKTTNSEQEADNELIAPFSCKVIKLFVSKGDVVKKGDSIVSVEAMKMEYTYTSPKDGKISDTLVQADQIIQEGTEFVTWEDK